MGSVSEMVLEKFLGFMFGKFELFFVRAALVAVLYALTPVLKVSCHTKEA